MAFTFLHAADLHLGSPFVGLSLKDEDVARSFAAASRGAFSDLITRAIETKVSFVVIAGDVYDGEWRDTSIGLFFNREVARLDRAGIPLFLLKGNHDAESVITKSISLPNSVSQFPTNKPKTFRIEDLKVALHGRSFPDRAVNENYALSYPDPVPGWFNIGVLHTSCDGRPGHETYAPCTVQDLVTRGYQYWALGHAHEYEVIADDPHIVFSGNLQGRSIRECGPKGGVLVDVADGHVTNMERLIVDRARWAIVPVNLDGISDELAALQKIEEEIRPAAKQSDGRLLALRVHLEGTTELHRSIQADPRRFSEEVQAAAHRCGADIWLESVRIETKARPVPTSLNNTMASIDLATTLDTLIRETELRNRATALITEITAKLPSGSSVGEASLGGNLDALFEDARALALARATPKLDH